MSLGLLAEYLEGVDGEAVAGDGSEGIQAEARHRPGSLMAFAAFDLLALDGHSVMAELCHRLRTSEYGHVRHVDGDQGRGDRLRMPFKPKGTRHVAHTRLMGAARLALLAIVIIFVYLAFRARSGG